MRDCRSSGAGGWRRETVRGSLDTPLQGVLSDPQLGLRLPGELTHNFSH